MNSTVSNNTLPTFSRKRIVKNTVFLYFRQIIVLLVSLFTVRLVLNALGAEDYGIYNVVGGVVTMFSFLTGAMSTATQRYLSFALGKRDLDLYQKTFSLSMLIYLGLCAAVVLLSETFGLWFVYNKLIIPAERLNAALWVYHCSVLSFVFSVMTAPYMASIVSHEHMSVYAFMSLFDVFLKIAVVIFLYYLPFDSLKLYAVLLCSCCFLTTSIYKIICRIKYPECRFSFYWNRPQFKEMLSFMGWNFFGAAVGVAKNQGLNIILNLYFGPIVNAARAVAGQVNGAVTGFAGNFSSAIRPQIVKTYAMGKKAEHVSLLFQGSQGTFLLMYLFTLPLILEAPYVLDLWLKNPPGNTVLFVRLTLIDALIDSVSWPIMSAAQATGKIKLYQSTVGGILLLNFPVSWVALALGAPAYAVFIVSILITVIAFLVRVVIVSRLVGFSLRRFLKSVLIPIFIVSLAATFPVTALFLLLPDGIVSLVCVSAASLILLSFLSFYIILSPSQRDKVRLFLKSKIRKNHA